MVLPLMPRATAVWLVRNTSLTFDQISEFCGLHVLEIQAIADEEVAFSEVEFDPIANKQLTKEEISRCEKDSSAKLQINSIAVVSLKKKKKKVRYTPISKRQDRPNAIAWFLKHHPEISDMQICNFLGTTKQTINAIRNKTHKKSKDIQARNPVDLGLCTQEELNTFIGNK